MTNLWYNRAKCQTQEEKKSEFLEDLITLIAVIGLFTVIGILLFCL